MEDNYPIAQIYLAECYYNGYGTEKSYDLAFKYYQKSVENESIIGSFYLENCYKFGIRIGINKLKAFEWYEKSAKQGNSNA